MTLLHVVQPELDLVHEPLSFYVHGRVGWLLGVALAAFGASAVWQARAEATRRRNGWLGLFGLGMIVAAVVPSDPHFPWEDVPTIAGLVHAGVAVLSPPLLLIPMWQQARTRRPGSRRHWVALAGYLTGIIACSVSLSWGLILAGSPPAIGVAERWLAGWAVYWLWLNARRSEPPR
jgi:hypothetical protein